MEQKICTKCNQPKELSEFKKQSATKDGLSYSCRVCAKLTAQSHYNNNKNKIISQVQNWKARNPEKVKEHQQNRGDNSNSV